MMNDCINIVYGFQLGLEKCSKERCFQFNYAPYGVVLDIG